jgi:hypothetical protein
MAKTIQINMGERTGTVHFSDGSTASYTTIPKGQKREQLIWARHMAIWIAKNISSANKHFKGLGKNKSLSDLLYQNPSIWIHYHADPADWGFTDGTDVWICPKSFQVGRWSTLGTLIHELAHIAGAAGGASKDAELTLLHCGLGRRDRLGNPVFDPQHAPMNPTIQG